MDVTDTVRVTGRNGLQGIIETSLLLGGSEPQVLLRLDSGEHVLVPSKTLQPRADGSFFLTLGLDELESAAGVPDRAADAGGPLSTAPGPSAPQAPAAELRFIKISRERAEVVDQMLLEEHADIRRVPVRRLVDERPPIRRDGNTLIVPLVEEVLVIEKRLMVREELHITRRQEHTRHVEQVLLVSEAALVTEAPQALPAEPGPEDET